MEATGIWFLKLLFIKIWKMIQTLHPHRFALASVAMQAIWFQMTVNWNQNNILAFVQSR